MSEAFDPQRWRPAPFLPQEDARDPALLFVVAVLSFLACLTALGVIASSRAAQGWTDQLTAEATVIVRARGGETPDAAAARAAEVLAGVPGVSEARALEKEKAYALIEPWIGDVADLDDLPVPRLVAVGLDARKPATAAALGRALKAQELDAVVDDHSVWIEDIRGAAEVVRWIASAILLLIAGAAAAVVAFATRAGIAARKDVVEVLHLTGAEDGQISNLFELRFAGIAAVAGAAGALAAGLLGGALRLVGGGEGITPALPIAWVDLLVVLPCPVLAALVAAVAARITARRLIQRL
ncbi:cell division protein FtsX [Phenylobacterium kunshanense]|uniref:ABC transporter permease n=1 Tax=Phenylobacterium kunshanense TaxID=1445034 RepID=A0A328B634_9CAUL|nr:FtsX-like permease family protein [Phenylobacterium kunshanense]RAK62830.1 ABC transporter permease [Phenylobacterium kunshanense]